VEGWFPKIEEKERAKSHHPYGIPKKRKKEEGGQDYRVTLISRSPMSKGAIKEEKLSCNTAKFYRKD